MTEQDFAFVAGLVLDRCALVLDSSKEYLIQSRLAPLARQHGLGTVEGLLAHARTLAGSALATDIVEAMVTTETSFFRDVHPFEELRKSVLPELIQLRRAERRLSIWCAAAASGQEPYSVALLLKEHFPELLGWDVKLLATDISRPMLERARQGRFSQVEVNRGMPIALLMKHFTQEGANWQLREGVRSMVEFRPLNLAGPWPVMPPMDLVLLRNVMIYFNVETKKSILRRVRGLLGPGGYLVLGGAETTFSLDDSFRRVERLKSGFYQVEVAR